MSVSPGQTITRDITVRNPVTLEAANADSISGVNVLNGVNGTALTIVNKSIGIYTVTGLVPSNALDGAQYQWVLSGEIVGIPDSWTYEFTVKTDTTPQTTRIECIRGDTFRKSATGLGSLVSVTDIWFTVKSKKSDTDANAIIQMSYTNGLEIFKALGSYSSALASIVITDEDDGDISLYLDETLTKDLPERDFFYDIQALTGSDVVTLRSGTFATTDDVTRAVS